MSTELHKLGASLCRRGYGAQPQGAIGVTGSAGSGKTTLANLLAADMGETKLADLLTGEMAAACVYSIDWRFIGSSRQRRDLLLDKQEAGWASLRDACNQFNWWNWDAVEADLAALLEGRSISIQRGYDRRTGKLDFCAEIGPARWLLVEGALLGPPPVVATLNQILYVYTPPAARLLGLLANDSQRRAAHEVAARFLITQYSERIYYEQLWRWASEKIRVIDREGKPLEGTWEHYLPQSEHLPVHL